MNVDTFVVYAMELILQITEVSIVVQLLEHEHGTVVPGFHAKRVRPVVVACSDTVCNLTTCGCGVNPHVFQVNQGHFLIPVVLDLLDNNSDIRESTFRQEFGSIPC